MESSLSKTVTLITITANTEKLAQNSLVRGNYDKWRPVWQQSLTLRLYTRRYTQRSILQGAVEPSLWPGHKPRTTVTGHVIYDFCVFVSSFSCGYFIDISSAWHLTLRFVPRHA